MVTAEPPVPGRPRSAPPTIKIAPSGSRDGVLAEVTRILAAMDISIEAILQKEPRPGDTTASVVILTHQTREKIMNEALEEIQKLDSIPAPITRIRAEHLD